MKFIHHDENIDIESLIKLCSSKYIGLDANDFQNFIKGKAEIHSFVSRENGENRIKRGLYKILKRDETQSILYEAKSFMCLFCYSSDNVSSISVKEIQESNEILDTYFSGKNILWGLSEDNILKDSVKVVILARI